MKTNFATTLRIRAITKGRVGAPYINFAHLAVEPIGVMIGIYQRHAHL